MERNKQQTQPSPHEDDVYGQYASDYAGSATNDVPDDFTGTLGARGDGSISFHGPNSLFDELSPTPDEADGHIAREASELDENGLGVTNKIVPYVDEQRGDAADEWLREHDPHYGQ